MDSGTESWSQWQRPRPTAAQRRGDVFSGLGVLAGGLLMTVLVNSMGMQVWGTGPALAEQLMWAAAITAPLVVRRSYPLVVLLVVGALLIVVQLRQTGDNLVPSVALFLAIYTSGAWERNRTVARWSRIGVIAVMFGWLGLSLVVFLSQPSPEPLPGAMGPLDPVLASVLHGIAFNVVYFLSAYFFGELAWVSARRQAELERRAEELRHSQEENTRGAIVAERVRIARDLHDVVAHHVSVMGVQAGAARRVLASDPELASSALRTVEDTARTAIGELHGLLGVLRAGDTESGRENLAGLDQLPDLVTAARSAGLEVEHGVYGQPRPVPDGVALSAYRVVQEALTNVVKHARARRAEVRVRYLDSTLEVEVTDDGRGAAETGRSSGGFGLLGMRERISVHGGELETGPRQGSGYRVRASFPAAATAEVGS
ncbi:histidine kinase [Actinophytocola xinjiangensis]|uniref:histidine kinase n=1 Tax=Actinophytocola xinjiangensis TaxID=485602 RepID=A0A7Z0WNX3_9PSEU|nr:sensor histidine kinase [Actinophytocola xinjiangensis]OLF12031.1 histidine kinase [Actinophytocola xinjiangensis]